jgi:hypothetical protein
VPFVVILNSAPWLRAPSRWFRKAFHHGLDNASRSAEATVVKDMQNGVAAAIPSDFENRAAAFVAIAATAYLVVPYIILILRCD